MYPPSPSEAIIAPPRKQNKMNPGSAVSTVSNARVHSFVHLGAQTKHEATTVIRPGRQAQNKSDQQVKYRRLRQLGLTGGVP
ncbi:hypothetical protein ES703_94724 [subsurface metagenome]